MSGLPSTGRPRLRTPDHASGRRLPSRNDSPDSPAHLSLSEAGAPEPSRSWGSRTAKLRPQVPQTRPVDQRPCVPVDATLTTPYESHGVRHPRAPLVVATILAPWSRLASCRDHRYLTTATPFLHAQ